MWQQREFLNFNGRPPILVFSPTYCILGGELMTAEFSLELQVGDMRYELLAVTVNENDHFKAALKLQGGWFWYDGLVGTLTGPRENFCQGNSVPEHVVYVRIM